MGDQGLPVAVAAFWVGLLAWDVRPDPTRGLPWWAWVAAGFLGVAVAWRIASAPRSSDLPGRLGLVGGPHPAVAAVAAAGTRSPAGSGDRCASPCS